MTSSGPPSTTRPGAMPICLHSPCGKSGSSLPRTVVLGSDLRPGHAASARHNLHSLRPGNAAGNGQPSHRHARIWAAEPPYGRHSSIEQSLSPLTPESDSNV